MTKTDHGLVAKLDGVVIKRGLATLLDGLSLEIADTDRWVVIGPNGAGKTTLLTLLAAQAYPSRGTVSLLGETLGHVDVFELRPRIGVAAQTVANRIPPDEKVFDVVMSAAYGVIGRWHEHYEDIDRNRADSLLHTWQADHLAGRTFGTLSEGERKRVEIARALMTDPELLLLDEPSVSLDLGGRETLVRSLAGLCLDPAAPATVLVTHHLEEIPNGITHALLLNKGQAVAAGVIGRALTSESLSATYEMPLKLRYEDGRWSARLA